MQIVSDEPGRRIVLEERDERMPLRFVLAGLALTLVMAAPWRVLWRWAFNPSSIEVWDPVPSAITLLLGLYLVIWARGGTRLERLSVDRDAGRIEWRHTHAAGVVSWTSHLDLAAIESLTIERETGELRAPRPLWFHLNLKRRTGRVNRLKLRVGSISEVGELTDLAHRLAAAIGLGYSRVARKDAFAFEVELSREATSGALPISSTGLRPTHGEEVEPGAGPPPPFDPAIFRGSMEVTRWEPGLEVVFKKGWSRDILLSPLLIGAALPVLSWLRLPSLHEGDLLPRMVALAMITLVGLALALVGFVSLLSGLPRSVRLDWAGREVTLAAAGSRRVIPFGDIRSIELRGRIYRHRNIRLYTDWHAAAIRASLGRADAGASSDELLIDTTGSRDPAEITAMAEPLATELAKALKVPLIRTREG